MVTFVPLDSRRKHEEIAEQVRDLAFSRRLSPGDRLPPERLLAAQFNASRGAVRDALRHLESRGFLMIKRGRRGGAYLQAMHCRQLAGSFGDMLRLGQVSVEQLLDARLGIEVSLIRFIKKDSGREWLAPLARNVEEAELLRRASARDPAAGSELLRNLHEFHHLLSAATGNPVFSLAVETIIAILGNYLAKIGHHTCVSLESVTEHRAIFEAIRAGRLHAAQRAMDAHLRADSRRTVALIRRSGSESTDRAARPTGRRGTRPKPAYHARSRASL